MKILKLRLALLISLMLTAMIILTGCGTSSPASAGSGGTPAVPAGSKTYMTVMFSSNLYAISNTTGLTLATIPLKGQGAGVAVNTTTKKLYVCAQAGASVNNFVQVVDTTKNTITSITLPLGRVPNTVTADPATNLIYVNNQDGTISIINGATDTLIGTTTTTITGGSAVIKINPVTSVLYALGNDDMLYTFKYNAGTNTYTTQAISLLNIASGSIHPLIIFHGIDIDTSTNTIYGAASQDNFYVINGTTNTLTTRITLTGNVSPDSVAVASNSQRVYVGSTLGGCLFTIDATTNTILSSTPLGVSPQFVGLDPTNGNIGIVSTSGWTAQSYNPATNTVSTPANMPGGAVGIAISP